MNISGKSSESGEAVDPAVADEVVYEVFLFFSCHCVKNMLV